MLERITLLSALDPRKLTGRRVLVRVDLNLPLTAEGIADEAADWRLRAVVPTIQRLQGYGASIVLMAHLGRPGGRPNPHLRLEPVARRLAALLRDRVLAIPGTEGAAADAAARNLGAGEIALVENLRFNPGEERNSRSFAEHLASWGSAYVNDAFAVSHRNHASIVGVPRILPSAAGLLMEREIQALARIRTSPPQPLIVVMGGAKIKTKAPVIAELLPKAAAIVVGGAIANTMLKAKGVDVGASLAEEMGAIPLPLDDPRIVLPTDVVVAPSFDAPAGEVVSVTAVPPGAVIVDIGPATQECFRSVLKDAAAVVWNGPMGYMENAPFAAGSRAVAEAVAAIPDDTVVGGGETVAMLQKWHLLERIGHVSTGGAAMLEYLARGTLPGIEALIVMPL